jgi:NADH-quinone oxidoreductase subunit E
MTFFTAANLKHAREIIAQYPRAKSAILPLAHLAQDQHGWLPPEAMEQIGQLTGVTTAEVLGTCSFYTMFKRRPCGRFVVSVCTNVTCLVTGGPEVLEYLEEKYASDLDVTIEEVECIAACGGAPALQVNYEFHENVTPESAEQLVEDYKSGAREARTVSGVLVGLPADAAQPGTAKRGSRG